MAFQDVSADNLTDIIVIAKCGAKSGVYGENRGYLNNGKYLVTRPESNASLSEMKTIREIVQFTRDNPRMFSLIIDASASNSQS